MSRFKHRFQEPFGKAGLTVAIIALVMALIGGAYAAGGLTKAQEKQVTKIAKKYAGKPGAPGATGPAGTNGTNGKDGTNGTPGAVGKSVVVSNATTTPSGECPTVGGTKFEVEGAGSPRHVCNGSPWTAGGTLPKGSSETGTWSASGTPSTFAIFHVLLSPVSFPIPLAAPLTNEEECGTPSHPACPVHVIGWEEGEGEPNEAEAIENGECTGTVTSPGAAEGNACIFVGGLHENLLEVVPTKTGYLLEPNAAGAGADGTVLFVKTSTSGGALVSGTWAVTAG
jgi:hypothetical protein